MPEPDLDTVTATARLPNIDIEVVHRRSPDGSSEQISVNVQAVPSFEAVGRYLEATNPFAFWMEATQLVWMSWMQTASAMMMLPLSPGLALPKPGASDKQPGRRPIAPRPD